MAFGKHFKKFYLKFKRLLEDLRYYMTSRIGKTRDYMT